MSNRSFGSNSNVSTQLPALLADNSPFLALLTDSCQSTPKKTGRTSSGVGALDRVRVDDLGTRCHSLDEVIGDLAIIAEETTSAALAGAEPSAVAGDLVATILNNSIFTFKCAGPQVLVEQAVISRMAHMVGYDAALADGHFLPDHNLSNLTALSVARNEAVAEAPTAGMSAVRARLYASSAAHLSISKAAMLLGLGRDNLVSIRTNDRGEMDADALADALAADAAAGWTAIAVVATAGTVVLGAFDPIEAIAAVCARHKVWLHVDASYGGSLLLSPTHRGKLAGIARADSVSWCPHKLMGVPEEASAVLFRAKRLSLKHMNETSSTYLFQVRADDEDDVNPGRSTVQCTRRNDALKVWTAWRHLGDVGYAARVDAQLETVQQLAERVNRSHHCVLVTPPQAVTIAFETPGVSPAAVCESLARMNVGYCLVAAHTVNKGKPIVSMSVPNPDVPLATVTDLLDQLFKQIESLSTTEQ